MRVITEELLTGFERALRSAGRAEGTAANYLRHVRAFAGWLDGAEATREAAIGWRGRLIEGGYGPATVNAMLTALNRFFAHAGWDCCRAPLLRVQRRAFRDGGRELTRAEYERLVAAAMGSGRERLALVMETICATGIRVSELRYITVEAARLGRAEISLKGKIRTILLPGKLCRKLRKYAAKNKTASGEIFLTGSGRSLGRKQIWAEMKALCAEAGVAAGKVFPHNLRHLFARAFYRVSRDIVKLADVLGHSSIETTRIYLISTGAEHAKTLARLGLVV